jgi:hypothetical protein
MAHDPKELLINFNGLVKNRLGPYRIVLKNHNGMFLTSVDNWYCSDKAYDYCLWSPDPQKVMYLLFKDRDKFGGSAYLTTAAGDIELKREHFKSKAF